MTGVSQVVCKSVQLPAHPLQARMVGSHSKGCCAHGLAEMGGRKEHQCLTRLPTCLREPNTTNQSLSAVDFRNAQPAGTVPAN